jgi:uncharacterized protein
MRYCWDEVKRLSNLLDHEIDFVDAQAVFEGPTFTYPDNRYAYRERRFITLGLLKGIPVSIAHTETDEEIRVISFRKATDNETQILFSQIQDQLPPPEVDEKPRRSAHRRAPGGKSQEPRGRDRKASISLRVDSDVLDWFRGTGSGYQSRMNAVLRAFRDAAAR